MNAFVQIVGHRNAYDTAVEVLRQTTGTFIFALKISSSNCRSYRFRDNILGISICNMTRSIMELMCCQK